MVSPQSPMPPGWYHAQGDPPGSSRYWDGHYWIGEPQLAAHDIIGQAPAGNRVAPAHEGVAEVGERIGGRVIDAIITGILFFIGAIVVGVSIGSAGGVAELAFAIPFSLAPFFWDMLWIKFAGGTPGKLIIGMQVVDAKTLSPASWANAALRSSNRLLTTATTVAGVWMTLVGTSSSGIVGLVGLVSLIMMSIDDKNRTVMDRIGSTLVVKR